MAAGVSQYDKNIPGHSIADEVGENREADGFSGARLIH